MFLLPAGQVFDPAVPRSNRNSHLRNPRRADRAKVLNASAEFASGPVLQAQRRRNVCAPKLARLTPKLRNARSFSGVHTSRIYLERDL